MIAGIARRIEEREAVFQTVREFARLVEERIGPCSVVLFGSYARGDFNLGSDIDVLVVASGLPATFAERLALLIGLVDAPIEPFAYTSEEFRGMQTHGHPTARAALTEGVGVHGPWPVP